MIITFTRTLATTRNLYRRGRIYDVPDPAAQQYIARGIARATAEDVETSPPPAPARPRRSRKPQPDV